MHVSAQAGLVKVDCVVAEFNQWIGSVGTPGILLRNERVSQDWTDRVQEVKQHDGRHA